MRQNRTTMKSMYGNESRKQSNYSRNSCRVKMEEKKNLHIHISYLPLLCSHLSHPMKFFFNLNKWCTRIIIRIVVVFCVLCEMPSLRFCTECRCNNERGCQTTIDAKQDKSAERVRVKRKKFAYGLFIVISAH